MTTLWARDVSKHFGGVSVLRGVSLTVRSGEMRVLIGANGAGKTTLLRILAGLLRADSGTIYLSGQRIDGWAAHRRHKLGMGFVWQTPAVVNRLSAQDNLFAAYLGGVSALRSVSLHRYGSTAQLAVDSMLERLGLARRALVRAGELSHAERKVLEIGCGLVRRPDVLLIDEPTAGLSERQSEDVSELLLSVHDAIAMVVVSHDLTFVRRLGAMVTFLQDGAILREGSIDTLDADPAVRTSYFGALER